MHHSLSIQVFPISVYLGFLLISGISVMASSKPNPESQSVSKESHSISFSSQGSLLDTAVFAGGCFWCMEPPFDRVKGVLSTTSGYSGGTEVNPTYEAVASGKTEHAEVVQVVFDANQISFDGLLAVFWRNIDPTDAGGQFIDRGRQYRSGIFYRNPFQKRAAIASKASLIRSGRFSKPIVTPIDSLSAFYRAEEYHQDYYLKNPEHYKRYRNGSGRDTFLKKHWSED